jgi:hypothetical protein
VSHPARDLSRIEIVFDERPRWPIAINRDSADLDRSRPSEQLNLASSMDDLLSSLDYLVLGQQYIGHACCSDALVSDEFDRQCREMRIVPLNRGIQRPTSGHDSDASISAQILAATRSAKRVERAFKGGR